MNVGIMLMEATNGAEGVVSQAAGEGDPFGLLMPLLTFGLIFVVLYFMMIRPQKKREKQAAQMRSSVQVGDEVVTSGGIVGLVVNIKDDTLVIETGSDRSKIRIKRWAVQSNETIHED